MKLFISWSGDLSHRVALHLKEWLPVVLPFVDPWVSSEDIPKGSRWAAELAGQLEATDAGVICIVPSNVAEPWMNFEAGALSKSVQKGRIHPFLFGLDTRGLVGPLAQFQATPFAKTDVHKLIRALNSEAGSSALAVERIDRRFEVCWPDLERRLSPMLSEARAISPAAGSSGSKESVPSAAPITEEELTVLRAIANAEDGLRRDEAAAVVHLHPQRAEHIMETLEGRGLLDAAHNYLYGTAWHLSKDGRAFLVKQKLL